MYNVTSPLGAFGPLFSIAASLWWGIIYQWFLFVDVRNALIMCWVAVAVSILEAGCDSYIGSAVVYVACAVIQALALFMLTRHGIPLCPDANCPRTNVGGPAILAIIAVVLYFGAALGQLGNAHDRSERLRKIEHEKEERKARIEAARDVEAAAAN